jgi:hypothetical protein
MFNLGTGPKGIIPYHFNTLENETYVGEWPSMDYYRIDRMDGKARMEFVEWYKTVRSGIFDMTKELVFYCKQDVLILRGSVDKFDEIYKAITGQNVYDMGITLSSSCRRLFNSTYLKPNTIGTIPWQGYNRRQKASDIALKWLELRAREKHVVIQHARNRGEFSSCTSCNNMQAKYAMASTRSTV